MLGCVEYIVGNSVRLDFFPQNNLLRLLKKKLLDISLDIDNLLRL